MAYSFKVGDLIADNYPVFNGNMPFYIITSISYGRITAKGTIVAFSHRADVYNGDNTFLVTDSYLINVSQCTPLERAIYGIK